MSAAHDPDKTLPPQTVKAVEKKQPFIHGSLFGRYRIGRKLGEGGMGAVYLATDTILDREVALKIPTLGGNKELAAARFLREAQAAAGLQHPNICPIHDVGQIDGTHFLSMQFIEGKSLADRVAPKRPLDEKEAARIIRTVALAMEVAHQRKVIHRDLKPANVMMCPRNEPIIMDFGLARRAGSNDQNLTLQGDMMGTPNYMPPEQVSGDKEKVGPASDIYALGAMLYELLTGTPPFTGNPLEVLNKVAFEKPEPPTKRRAELDARFDAIVLKALAKKPEDRWKSMQAFADALAPLAGTAYVPLVSGLADGPTIKLRVVGTPYVYSPPPTLPIINIGRQKRKAGDPPDVGNDFVLRIAGNDALSARISRRHFELHRTATGYSVIDRSKTSLTRNGHELPNGSPVPLADGDLLCVAGVITLEVKIGTTTTVTGRAPALFEVPAPPGAGGGQLHFEASLGDMITLDG